MQYWILDSGASQHICSNNKASKNFKPIQQSTVIPPNNTSLPVHFFGDVALTHQLVLHDVLFVPQFHVNLISITFLTANTSLIVTFSQRNFMIQDSLNQKMIWQGWQASWSIHDPTEMLPIEFLHQDSSSTSVNAVSAQIWHNRLRYLSPKCLDLLKHQLQCNCLVQNAMNLVTYVL